MSPISCFRNIEYQTSDLGLCIHARFLILSPWEKMRPLLFPEISPHGRPDFMFTSAGKMPWPKYEVALILNQRFLTHFVPRPLEIRQPRDWSL